MIRKLIQQGKGGMTFTLPISWVRQQVLKPGADVRVDIVDSGLLISATNQTPSQVCKLVLRQEAEPFIRVALNNAYRTGSHRIEVVHQTKAQAVQVVHIAKTLLIGFEVVEQKEGFLALQSVASHENGSEKMMAARMFFIIRESLSLLAQALESDSFSKKAELSALTQDLDRCSNFYRRYLGLHRMYGQDIFFRWGICANLAVLQHSIFYAYNQISKYPKTTKASVDLFSRIFKYFCEVHEAFLAGKIDRLEQLHTQGNLLRYKELVPRFRRSPDAVSLLFFSEMQRTSYLLISPMMGVLLQG